MQLVFIDETSDNKYKEYLGFSVAMMNARFYPAIKEKGRAILEEAGWDPDVEFKGSYLFSSNKGCPGVGPEARVKAAHALLDLNTGPKNSRMSFHFARLEAKDQRAHYIHGVPLLLEKVLPRPKKGAGKNLISITCDGRDDIKPSELHKCIAPVVEKKKYVLLENVVSAKSGPDTVGIMYADLVGYLAGRVDTISNDLELFEGLSDEELATSGTFQKLRSSKALLSKIKKLSIYRPKL